MTSEQIADLAQKICTAADATEPPAEWAALDAAVWIEKRAEQIALELKRMEGEATR
jgi:hypothetical protein